MNIADNLRHYEAGERLAVLAAEEGISQVQMWRRLGKPARYRMNLPTLRPIPLFVAWAAGFFDGEGCVSITKRGDLSVAAAQTTPEPLDALQRAFGGSVRCIPANGQPRRDQWIWHAHGPIAMGFLHAVELFLLVKKPLVPLAEAAMALRCGRGYRLTDRDRADRLALHDAVCAINRPKRRA